MKTFQVVPKISILDTVKEFIEKFSLSPEDLVIASPSIWNRYFQEAQAGQVILIRKYGSGEPTDEMVEAIGKDVTKPYKRVVAIGGGTVIDAAKLFCLEKFMPVGDLFDHVFPAAKKVPLVIVPTTCGTGSEMTNISILEFKSRHTKFGLAADALYADDAVLVSQLLESLPFSVFAASSIDALVHSLESYLSPKATELSETLGLQAAKMILTAYKKIKEAGEEKKKEVIEAEAGKVLTASAMAGIAFGNAGCGTVHAMSYPLGAVYHVPHGEANYAVFTGVFKTYMKYLPEGKIKILNEELAEILDCEKADVYMKIEELLNENILRKKSLKEYGLSRAELSEFAHSVIANQQRLLENSYIPMTEEQILSIYESLYD